MPSRPSLILGLLAFLVVACGAPGASQPAQPRQPAAPEAQRKSISIAIAAEISSLITELGLVGSQALPTRYVHEFLNSYLTRRNQDDQVEPWLAERLPSLEDGTWKVFDDGRMEVTWQLRRGVQWHDGREVTSTDLQFGWEAESDVNTIIFPRSVARLIERVETPDPYTAVVLWAGPNQLGAEMGERQMDVLPRHLLEEVFRADPAGFSNHPYFVTPEAFVGSGAYRPTDWQRGGQLTIEAFDQYFLGRAKIDRVVFRFMRDQAALANLLSGAIDISYEAVPLEEARVVEKQWQPSAGGTVLLRPNNWRHLIPQFRPEYTTPADLLNPSVRKALAHALDREEVLDVLDLDKSLISNSIAFPGTPIGDAVDRVVARYPLDPARAIALLEDAGWRRAADGIQMKGDQSFRLEYHVSSTGDLSDIFPVIQLQLRRIGIDLTYAAAGPTDLQTGALYSGIAARGLVTNSLNYTTRWHSRYIASAANRFSGNNLGGYTNPSVDRAIDQLNLSVRMEDQIRWWSESWRLITEEVGAIGLYHYPNPYIARKGISGALPRMPLGSATYRVETWDVR